VKVGIHVFARISKPLGGVTSIHLANPGLLRYRQACGLDIRLLIVADHYNNSGKLMLEAQAILNVMGFQAVYFFPYPGPVIIFD
jgi:hypothetical protein